MRSNYRVPFIVWGPGIDQANLYAINPTYQNPGKRRPNYRGDQPIRNGDLANLSADLLGLDAVPGSRFNRDQTLEVVRRTDRSRRRGQRGVRLASSLPVGHGLKRHRSAPWTAAASPVPHAPARGSRRGRSPNQCPVSWLTTMWR